MRITASRRTAFFVVIDLALLLASVFVSFSLLSQSFSGAAVQLPLVLASGLIAAIVTTITFALIGVYRASWSFFGLRDVARLGAGIAAAALIQGGLAEATHVLPGAVPISRSIVLIQAPIALCALVSFRLSKRAWMLLRGSRQTAPRRRTILVGAGECGVQVLRSIQATGAPYAVQGFLDDDLLAQGTAIDGVPVLGPVASLERRVREQRTEVVVLCVAAARGEFVRDVVHRAQSAGIKTVRIVPSLSEIVGGAVSIASTREVKLEDLLGREAVRTNLDEVRQLLGGKRILVTGGAGTIGSELCRQVARFEPSNLVILDVDETRLHDLAVDLAQSNPDVPVSQALVDVRDKTGLAELFAKERPEIIFHAAAYKHVPMMEKYPVAALDVNVLGTANVVDVAEMSGCDRFVLISTDKAVDPSSIMGASKRIAELTAFSAPPRRAKPMIRSAVRFGNVIGSRGSVIPIFERQLKNGGPLTVTHPDMERFFMMIPEAVSLVLQAAALGEGQDLFVLDMGKPVRILDVARDFIRLHGSPERPIEILFTGLRPGEKLREVLNYENEELSHTKHPRVLRTTVKERQRPDRIRNVEQLVAGRDNELCRSFFEELFPSLERHANAPEPYLRVKVRDPESKEAGATPEVTR